MCCSLATFSSYLVAHLLHLVGYDSAHSMIHPDMISIVIVPTPGTYADVNGCNFHEILGTFSLSSSIKHADWMGACFSRFSSTNDVRGQWRRNKVVYLRTGEHHLIAFTLGRKKATP